MKIKIKQSGYNYVEMTLSLEELDVILDHIGEDQIAEVEVVIKKPVEADNGEED